MSPQEKLLAQYNNEKSIIAEMLLDYVGEHNCPCAWKQYESIVSKSFSSGYHDEYQNILAEATLALPCFEHTVIEKGFDVLLTCKCCQRKWRYLCEEWRMMAYRRRVVPEVHKVEVNEHLIGLPFSTAGFAPDASKIASIENWYLYMTGKELDVPAPHEKESSHPQSFIHKMLSLFRG